MDYVLTSGSDKLLYWPKNRELKSGERAAWYGELQSSMSRVHRGRRVELTLALTQPSSSSSGRYDVTVVDMPSSGQMAKGPNSCAVFLVPQGREHEWMFKAEEGQAQLTMQAGFARLLFVVMCRGQKFEDMKAVQAELSSYLPTLSPARLSGSIPYLTVANNIGNRTTVKEMKNEHTGDMVVEDVEQDGVVYRRLVFLASG